MIDMLQFMAAPFTACLVLVGLHAYVGIHVIERRILFVDLAVAQFAAMGAVVGFAFGHHPGEPGSTAFSLVFAVIAAALFALTRVRHEKLPQEAIIGITFVVASAVTILVADRAPEGAEHIKETLSGSLLWVTWPAVLKVLVIYAVLGLVHWLLRERFLLISRDPAEAWRRGLEVARILSDFSAREQADLVRFLSANGAQNVTRLWIVNAVCCEASAELIRLVAVRPDVEYVGYDIAYAPDVLETPGAPTAPDATPPG